MYNVKCTTEDQQIYRMTRQTDQHTNRQTEKLTDKTTNNYVHKVQVSIYWWNRADFGWTDSGTCRLYKQFAVAPTYRLSFQPTWPWTPSPPSICPREGFRQEQEKNWVQRIHVHQIFFNRKKRNEQKKISHCNSFFFFIFKKLILNHSVLCLCWPHSLNFQVDRPYRTVADRL